MGVSGSEVEALQVVEEVGGKTVAQSVARKMGINVDYARVILTSLAKRDYLDLTVRGTYILTLKGRYEEERRK